MMVDLESCWMDGLDECLAALVLGMLSHGDLLVARGVSRSFLRTSESLALGAVRDSYGIPDVLVHADGGWLRAWDLITQTPRKSINLQDMGDILQLVKLDDRRVAVACRPWESSCFAVAIIDLDSGERLGTTYEFHEMPRHRWVNLIAPLPGGRLFDGVGLWDATTGLRLGTFVLWSAPPDAKVDTRRRMIRALASAPNGAWVATAELGPDGEVVACWDTSTFALRDIIQFERDSVTVNALLSASDRHLVLATRLNEPGADDARIACLDLDATHGPSDAAALDRPKARYWTKTPDAEITTTTVLGPLGTRRVVQRPPHGR